MISDRCKTLTQDPIEPPSSPPNVMGNLPRASQQWFAALENYGFGRNGYDQFGKDIVGFNKFGRNEAGQDMENMLPETLETYYQRAEWEIKNGCFQGYRKILHIRGFCGCSQCI